MPTIPAGLNKDTRDLLQRRLRDGLTVVADNAGHYEIHNGDGVVRSEDGKPIKIPGTPHGGRALKNLEKSLEAAGVFSDEEKLRLTPEQRRQAKARADRAREIVVVRQRGREAQIRPLRERYEKLFAPLNGLEPNRPDAAMIITKMGREAGILSPRDGQPLTPDLVEQTLRNFNNGAWVVAQYQQAFGLLADELEAAKDPVERYFELVRDVRGLPQLLVEEIKLVDDEWPFRVERLPLEALVLDHSYQRPPKWFFIRSKAASYDPSLVGTIDVSERRKGAVYAILDGQQRFEMTRMVGKQTLWCSIYSGLDVHAEARFFLHKNKDVQAVHPFYTFKARVVAQDPDAIAIDKLVAKHGYALSVGAARPGMEEKISAVAAIEQVGKLGVLDDVLFLLKQTTFGLEQGNNGILIRGLGRMLSVHRESELDFDRLRKVLAETLPTLLVNQARERARYTATPRHTSSSAEVSLCRILQEAYNKGLARGEKIEVRV